MAQYFNLEEGESLNYADITFETLGEFAFAPVEVTFAQLSAGRNEWVRAKNVSKENHLRKQIQFENTLDRAKEIDGQKSESLKQQVKARAKILEDVNQTPEEAYSQAIDEFIDASPEFKSAFEIYEDFTDSSRSPENFPTVVSNETGQYPNAFTVKTNEDGTFTIYDATGNPLVNPKTNQTYTYQSQQQALKIQRELSSISQIQYAIDTTQDILLMQNADKDNPTIKSLGKESYRVNTTSEIDKLKLSGKNVAVTAGASAPDHIVQEIIKKLEPKNTEFFENTNETEYFPLPKELRSNITTLSNFLLEIFPNNKVDPIRSVNKDKQWTATEALSSL